MNRPQPKFNIGDRVKVIEDTDRYTHKGNEYIIEDVIWRWLSDDYVYRLNNKSPILYTESALELVKSKSFIPTPKNKPSMPPVEPPKSVSDIPAATYDNEEHLKLIDEAFNAIHSESTKSPTLSEVVDLIKEMRIIMTIQGRNGDDITRMAHNICKQYGYELPEGIEKE